MHRCLGLLGIALFLAACSDKGSSPTQTGVTGVVPVVGIGGSGTSGTSGTSTQDPNAGIYELVPGNSGGGGSASITGTVGGDGLTPTTAVFDIVGDDQGNPLSAYVVMASDPNFCNDFVQNQNQIANSTHLVIEFFSIDSNDNLQAISTAETFNITSNPNLTGNVSGVAFLPLDANCNVAIPSADVQGTAGTVSINVLNATSVSGTFSATLDPGEQISGSFQAQPCPGLANIELSNTITLGCQ